jgi:hypothetical protein
MRQTSCGASLESADNTADSTEGINMNALPVVHPWMLRNVKVSHSQFNRVLEPRLHLIVQPSRLRCTLLDHPMCKHSDIDNDITSGMAS